MSAIVSTSLCHSTETVFDAQKPKQTQSVAGKKRRNLFWTTLKIKPPGWKICSSSWIISPGRGENKTCLKPPPSKLGGQKKLLGFPLKWTLIFYWIFHGSPILRLLPKSSAAIEKKKNICTRWAPASCRWGYGAPTNALIDGYWGYKPTYRSYNIVITPFITGRGPPCKWKTGSSDSKWRSRTSHPKIVEHLLASLFQAWLFWQIFLEKLQGGPRIHL